MKQLISCLFLLLSFACFNSNESITTNANSIAIPEAIPFEELSTEEQKDRAEIVYKAGIYDTAILFYERMISLGENDGYLYARLSSCYYYQEDYEKSLNYGLKALDILKQESENDPDKDNIKFLLEASYNLARIYISKDYKDLEKALPYWDAVWDYHVKSNPTEQRDLEMSIIIAYIRTVAYHEFGDDVTPIKMLEEIYYNEAYDQLYENWVETKKTTDLGDEPYHMYETLFMND